MRWSSTITPYILLVFACFGLPSSAEQTAYRVETFAGTSDVGDGGEAVEALLAGAEGVALDPEGNLYIADTLDHRVRRVDARTGIISTIAGTGNPGFGGDGGAASVGRLDRPYGVAFANGILYLTDYGNGRVRQITAEGTIETVAGGGVNGGRNGAKAARLSGPRNVAVDAAGNLYISDFLDHRVYRVSPNGSIYPFAGTGNAGFTGDGPATASELNAPAGLAVDAQGTVYVVDSGNNLVRKIAGGRLETILGDGEIRLSGPAGVAVDAAGNLYVADSGNRRLLRRDAAGNVRTVAVAEDVRDVAVDFAGRVVFTTGRRVYRCSGDTDPVLVTGCEGCDSMEEDAHATSVRLGAPTGIAVDAQGGVYIADEGGYRVLKVDLEGKATTAAGVGAGGFSGDGGPAAEAELGDPVAVAAGSSGALWIADFLGQRVHRVEANGVIASVVGTGRGGYAGDSGLARLARLNGPRGVTVDSYGNLYIADSRNNRVRQVDGNGYIRTVAGTGVRGHSGDRGLGVLAQVDTPTGLTVDDEGNLYIAEQGSHVIRMLRNDGLIFTVAGSGVGGFGGDGGKATEARLDAPSGVAVDTLGNIYIADTNNNRIRRVDTDGIMETIAGTGEAGFGGDGGFAREALFRSPSDVDVDLLAGTVYVADTGNKRVRKLTTAPAPSPTTEPPGECRVLHAASYGDGPVAPGQIVSVFAEGIGPSPPAGAQLTSSGLIADTLGETSVRVSGVSAPLLYAGGDQVNAQIPYSVENASVVELEAWVAGRLLCSSVLDVRPATPGIFAESAGGGGAVAVNQDGSLNSLANPAERGSVVVFYATGEGQTSPPGVTGQPAAAPLGIPKLPVEVRIAGLPTEVLYAGAAPGLVGVMQVNVRIPPAFIPSGTLRLELFLGGFSSQPGVTIAVE